jgi:hypothetical protein
VASGGKREASLKSGATVPVVKCWERGGRLCPVYHVHCVLPPRRLRLARTVQGGSPPGWVGLEDV